MTSEELKKHKNAINKAWRERHREAYKKLQAEYRRKHAAKRKAYSLTPGRMKARREWMARDYANNKAKYKVRCRSYRERNAELLRITDKAKSLRRKQADPERFSLQIRNACARRRAKIRGLSATAVAADMQKLKQKQKKCLYCGKRGRLTFDHIIPIARGGAHSIDNLVMACLRCNQRKNARDPQEFAQSIGLLFV